MLLKIYKYIKLYNNHLKIRNIYDTIILPRIK